MAKQAIAVCKTCGQEELLVILKPKSIRVECPFCGLVFEVGDFEKYKELAAGLTKGLTKLIDF